MKNDASPAEQTVWRDCTTGELVDLGAQQRRRDSRRLLIRNVGLAAAGCAVVGAVGALGFWRRQEQPEVPAGVFAPGGIACDEVTRLLPAFVAHELSSAQAAKVREHLASCGHCTEKLKKLQHSQKV